MIPLLTQAEFEKLLQPETEDGKAAAEAVVVYFTAEWCKACKKLDLDALQSIIKDSVWYKCDVDQNTYTLGYCGLSKLPSFGFIKNGKFVGKVSSSVNDVVSEAIRQSFSS